MRYYNNGRIPREFIDVLNEQGAKKCDYRTINFNITER